MTQEALAVARAQEQQVSSVLHQARIAQDAWSRQPVRERLRFLRELRSLLAVHGARLTKLFSAELQRTAADSLTAEIIPLAEACRFLQLEAERILRTEQLSRRGRPRWLRRVDILVRREPFGVVLVIGPANYPLFLPAVQALQALVAGNAVLIKPGRGAAPVLGAFAAHCEAAGLPSGLLTVLDESVAAAESAIESGVDKVVLTGSVQSGTSVLRQAAEHIIPSIVELSGDDPVFVLPGADLKKAAQGISFGTTLNGGFTCIAPRRIYVDQLVWERLRPLLTSASQLAVTMVRSEAEALELAARSSYALGATIFGAEAEALRLAEKVNAGVVVINDMIVPTADPRVSFGGRALSGFGKTRGREGLLEMTSSKAVLVQKGRRLRHLEPPPPFAEALFLEYLAAQHSRNLPARITAWRNVIRIATGKRREGVI